MASWIRVGGVATAVLISGCLLEVDSEEVDVESSEVAASCGGFIDVDTPDYFCQAVARIKSAGITKGCNPPSNTQFCPDDPVTRAQMATFLARALGVAGKGSASCGYKDVKSTDPHRHNICMMKTLGITMGCNPPSNDAYCPNERTTRGQMAAFLSRALALPSCSLSNYTDVPASHLFSKAICGLWKAGIAVSYLQPDPANNRFNNTYGPDQWMDRGDMAVFLDRAFLAPPDKPLKATIGSTYRSFLLQAQSYAFTSNTNYRAGEVLALIYSYRAARKVDNLPAGFSLAALQAKIQAGADQILATYKNDCYAGHSGNGTSYAGGCPRFGAQENFDAGSTNAIAVLETVRLLHEIGGTANKTKAGSYWSKALYVVAHMNDDHRVTSPCTGWSNENGDLGIKWNKSNRWAIANHLVSVIRARGYHGGDGVAYRDNARAALSCFKNDLRNDAKYRCSGGKRCYDSSKGPWWSGWHSDFHSNIEDDVGHGSASAMMVFYAVFDQWNEGAFGYGDLDQFRKHFLYRRKYSASRQYRIPQYPDSDTFPGNKCSSPTLSGNGGCDDVADDWDSQNVGAWIRAASLYGQSSFRGTARNMVPTWSTPTGSARHLALTAGAFALFGEVGSPRRLSL